MFDKLIRFWNYKRTIHEFFLCEREKGHRYFGIKQVNYTYEGIGKHYCSIGLWKCEIQFFNSLKA